MGVVGVPHRTLKFTSCVPTVLRRCFHFQKEWGMWGGRHVQVKGWEVGSGG